MTNPRSGPDDPRREAGREAQAESGADGPPDRAVPPPVDEEALARAYEAGLAAEKRGAPDEAARFYREALRLDPADRCGVSVRLAAIGCADPPPGAPPAYVETLFDQHAEIFDAALVGALSYRAPMLLRDRLERLAPGPYARMLDLGCGTGLAGEALRDLCARIDGVDLSAGMLELADERGAYDELYMGEAVEFLRAPDEAPEDESQWDLIVATDVLPYMGDVAPLLEAAAAVAAPGAVLALTTETPPPDLAPERGWLVAPNHRYAHRESYLRAALAEAGFSPFHVEDIVVRTNEGRPEPGQLFLARREG